MKGTAGGGSAVLGLTCTAATAGLVVVPPPDGVLGIDDPFCATLDGAGDACGCSDAAACGVIDSGRLLSTLLVVALALGADDDATVDIGVIPMLIGGGIDKGIDVTTGAFVGTRVSECTSVRRCCGANLLMIGGTSNIGDESGRVGSNGGIAVIARYSL